METTTGNRGLAAERPDAKGLGSIGDRDVSKDQARKKYMEATDTKKDFHLKSTTTGFWQAGLQRGLHDETVHAPREKELSKNGLDIVIDMDHEYDE